RFSASMIATAARWKGCERSPEWSPTHPQDSGLSTQDLHMANDLDVIILAAGLGTRMKSDTIKILHRAAGRPIIDYVLDLASEISDRPPIMVVGHQRDVVQQLVGDRARYAVQDEARGTGHAVLQE